jgi:hypothetical protein
MIPITCELNVDFDGTLDMGLGYLQKFRASTNKLKRQGRYRISDLLVFGKPRLLLCYFP